MPPCEAPSKGRSAPYPKEKGGEKQQGASLFKAIGQALRMKGTIEALKLQTDRKKQRYAVATINGEDIYTWDGAMIESLRSVGEGALAKYELAEKGDFKFQKFESLTVVKGDGEQTGPRRAGWPDERIRYLGPTEIKSRTEMVKLAGIVSLYGATRISLRPSGL
jgi:hypothetical protein